jgi:hypothetical protein
MDLAGFEPALLDSESKVLTITPQVHKKFKNKHISDGTRTHNLSLRRGTRYPITLQRQK